MITINVVTGGPIEDPKHEASSENVIKNADVSDVDVLSRRKRSSCCWKVEVSYTETHHVQREQWKIFEDYFQEPGLVNGHVHYTSSDGHQAIWFNKKKSNWSIGNVEWREKDNLRAAAHSGTCGKACRPDCPNEVGFTWRYWNTDPDLFLDANKGLSIWCKS